MANIAIIDRSKIPIRVIQYIESVNTPDFDKRDDVIVQPDISLLKDVPIIYWKVQNGSILEMSQSEKESVDLEIKTIAYEGQKAAARESISGLSPETVALKAMIQSLLDRINLIETQLNINVSTFEEIKQDAVEKVELIVPTTQKAVSLGLSIGSPEPK